MKWGGWVYVSLGFLLVGFRRTKSIPELGLFYKNEGIILEAIIGDSYSITFGDGLVTVKPQPVTSQKSLNDKSNWKN